MQQRLGGWRIALLMLLGLGLSLASASAQADDAKKADEPKKNARLLMVTQSAGFKHGSVSRKDKLAPAEQAIEEIGVASGLFRADFTQDVAKEFTKEALDRADIVFFYTTGNLPIPEDVREYFINTWLKQPGKGFIGTHSATDTYHQWAPYYEMINGTFNGHPWGSGSKVTVAVHDKSHPAMKAWPDEFEITDEIYQFKNWKPENVRVLASLNMAKTQLKKPYHVPIAWCKEWGKGKVFYISLGHREDVWTNPMYRESLTGAVKWILGHEKGDATPNPELSTAQDAKAKQDAEAK